LAREARSRVTVSIPFLRDDLARKIEPGASAPTRRFETLKMLNEAGVTTTVAIAPVIPGLNDPDVAEILERARAIGTRRAFLIMLRLPGEVLPVFRERINDELPPERVRKIEHAIQELRGGKMNNSTFGERFRGQGERWKAIQSMFDLHCRRLGFNEFGMDERFDDDEPTTFVRPAPTTGQMSLF
jgi:DNA repair photolyase